MPPLVRGAAADPPGRDDEQEHKLAALRLRVQAEAAAIRTADDWARCLQAAARLWESFANSLLIPAQRPDATLVKGYEDWRKTGRQVTRGEKGIEIFSAAPPRPDTRHRRAGRNGEFTEQDVSWRDAIRVAYVWDIAQTTGQPVARYAVTPAAPEEASADLWDALCWLARREGFAVEHERGAPADGVTFWSARRIRVLPDLSTAEETWALAHQLGHVLLHGAAAHPPGATTSGQSCLGVRKAEADAVAYLVYARHGTPATGRLTGPQTWAGTDPRAQPGAAILAAGQRITTAAARISRHVDHVLASQGISPPALAQVSAATRNWPHPQPGAQTSVRDQAAGPPAESGAAAGRVLLDACRFYISRLDGSWVPAYLHERGISQQAMGEWQIGYAPAGWTTLTTHLRRLGRADHAIEAAGLARRSSRGTLIDHFRDRVMLPVHDEHGNLVGFTGRARPGTGPGVPKYLNTPQAALYRKSELLFGLHQARPHLAAGAVPVIVEGPLDAIAVSLADPGQHAGLAPCGTALTSQHAALLGRAASLGNGRVIVAFDDDPPGRKAATRAYGILRPVSGQLQAAKLGGRDPAQILQDNGAQALRAILTTQLQPLSAVVIDTALSPWEHRLHEVHGPLLAMRNAAAVIAALLPAAAAAAIRRITAGRELATVDDQLRPVPLPELPEIARALPADSTWQIARVADRLGFTDYSDVLAEVVNAVTRQAARPASAQRDQPPRRAASCFPHPPLMAGGSAGNTSAGSRAPGKRPQGAQMKR